MPVNSKFVQNVERKKRSLFHLIKNQKLKKNTENEGSNNRRSCRRKEDSDKDLDAESDSDGEDGETQA